MARTLTNEIIDAAIEGFEAQKRTLSMNSGSFESLKVSLRCGCRPNARQIRLIVLRLKPECSGSEPVLQCVASRDRDSNVVVSTLSTSRR